MPKFLFSKGILGTNVETFLYFPNLCTHVQIPCSTHFSQEINSSSISRIKHKLKQLYKHFVISGHFDARHGEKVNAQKNYKLTHHA